MTLFRNINGVQVEMTPEEEQAVRAEWLKAQDQQAIEAQERFVLDVKAECKRRILAVADAETQQNIAQAGILYSAFRLNDMAEAEALSQAGLIEGDMTTAAAFRGWVAAMSNVAGALIMAGEDTYQDDTHWPAVPDGVLDLARRF